VPPETGLPCQKFAVVFEESVNETSSVTYTIKTQLKGKTRKDEKLRFYSTITVIILHNGKEWAVKKEDTTNI
jgi:uncharacterized protein with PhoU and TrkA domain